MQASRPKEGPCGMILELEVTLQRPVVAGVLLELCKSGKTESR